MSRQVIAASLLTLVALALPLVAQGQECNEFFQVSSSPQSLWWGLQPDGSNNGMGQSFTLNCDAQLETVAFRLSWGTDYGEVRSLAYGDTLNLSILGLDGQEIARKGWMVDANSASTVVTFYLHDDSILLPADTYIAAMWTAAPACGGIKYYAADVVAGSSYRSTNASDPTSWAAHASETYHTITLNSDITPVESQTWDALKAMYRPGDR